jgi:hypothetical protein
MEHIKDILDNTPLAALSEADLKVIRAHVANCVDCVRAFEAAQLSAMLISERAGETAQNALNADPFFQTRVLAAWREQQTTAGLWSFRRFWNATNALIASMAVTTAALAVLTFVVPANEVGTEPAGVTLPASAEAVMLDEAYADLTNEQVLTAIYGEEDEGE